MSSAEASETVAVRTRSKVEGHGDNFSQIKNLGPDQLEAKELIEDQVFHAFVEQTVDPDQGPIKDEDLDDFVPEDSVNVVDGSSSSRSLSSEEAEPEEPLIEINNPIEANELIEVNKSIEVNNLIEVNGLTEDNDSIIEVADLYKINGNTSEMLRNIPPPMAAAYRKRFPNFWRMQQGLRAHTGAGYDLEEDPDFVEEKEESASDSSSSSGEEIEVNDDMEKEIGDIANLVEDMIIPNEDSIVEVVGREDEESLVEAVDVARDEDETSSESSSQPSFIDLVDEINTVVDDDVEDIEYQPGSTPEDSDITVSESCSSGSSVMSQSDSEDSEIIVMEA